MVDLIERGLSLQWYTGLGEDIVSYRKEKAEEISDIHQKLIFF